MKWMLTHVALLLVVLTDARAADEKQGGPIEGKDWTVSGIGMEFVWVPAMKCWVGKYEVTNSEYRTFRSGHDSGECKGGHSLNGDRQPVAEVSYNDAVAFAVWLTERERQSGRLPGGMSYRLPDGDEWTAFAVCGDDREYPWGDDLPPLYGNYSDASAVAVYPSLGLVDGYRDGSVVSCAVESSGKNDWGLYGVGGNVWEWTSELSTDKEKRCLRGAAWYTHHRLYLPCEARRSNRPLTRNAAIGFRLTLSR